jgi:hypothetical protein
MCAQQRSSWTIQTIPYPSIWPRYCECCTGFRCIDRTSWWRKYAVCMYVRLQRARLEGIPALYTLILFHGQYCAFCNVKVMGLNLACYGVRVCTYRLCDLKSESLVSVWVCECGLGWFSLICGSPHQLVISVRFRVLSAVVCTDYQYVMERIPVKCDVSKEPSVSILSVKIKPTKYQESLEEPSCNSAADSIILFYFSTWFVRNIFSSVRWISGELPIHPVWTTASVR